MTTAIMAWGMIRRYVRSRIWSLGIPFVTLIIIGLFSLGWAWLFANDFRDKHQALGDFAAFYAVGAMLNQSPPQNIYDFQAHAAMMRSLATGIRDRPILPYAHAPFEALLFRPLAALPYRWAYLAWIGFSLVLFIGGYWLLSPLLPEMSSEQCVLGLLMLLSWPPLVLYSLTIGQVCALYFFSIACCLRLLHNGHFMLAGMALALATYKPTLLLLVGAMLLLTRQWRTVAGLLIGGVALAGVSLIAVGWSGCLQWIGAIMRFSRINGLPIDLRLYNYVDLKSFCQLLMPSHRGAATTLAAGVALAGASVLFRIWWHRPRADLAWSLALIWGIVLSPYGPMYEMVVVGIGMLLLVNSAIEREGQIPPTLKLLLALLYLVPWVSRIMAPRFGFQATTLVVAAVGVYIVWSVHQTQNRPAETLQTAENKAGDLIPR